jgi:hypothetical protein
LVFSVSFLIIKILGSSPDLGTSLLWKNEE